MKISVGHWVDGDEFFGRERELRNLSEILANPKASVLVPGPRRIGKTSLLKEFIRQNQQTYRFIYFDLESRQSVMALCRDLIKQVQKSYPQYVSKRSSPTSVWNTAAKMIPELKIAGLVEVKTGEIAHEVKEFMDRMEDLFEELVQQAFVFVFDEFSDFLWKLKETGGHGEVRLFLEWLRQLRQQGKIRLIVSGSINIVSTVEELNLSDLINDFTDLEIFPLPIAEISVFLSALLSHIGITLTDEAVAFAVDRLSDGIPFFIQLFASSLRSYRKTDDQLYDLEAIKELYSKITGKQHKEYIDLHSRLKDYLPKDEFGAAIKVLAHLSSDPMSFNDLWPYVETVLTVKERLSKLLKRLMDESYIEQFDREYRFVSPMLADWWQRSYEWER
jgi:uncharacterized protein